MRINPERFTIEFDDFDQHLGSPKEVAVSEAIDVFDETYNLFLATSHHLNDLDDQLAYENLSEAQVVELDNLDCRASHLHKLSTTLGGLVAAKLVDEFLEGIKGVSKFTPETSGFLAAATAGQRYIRSGSR